MLLFNSMVRIISSFFCVVIFMFENISGKYDSIVKEIRQQKCWVEVQEMRTVEAFQVQKDFGDQTLMLRALCDVTYKCLISSKKRQKVLLYRNYSVYYSCDCVVYRWPLVPGLTSLYLATVFLYSRQMAEAVTNNLCSQAGQVDW